MCERIETNKCVREPRQKWDRSKTNIRQNQDKSVRESGQKYERIIGNVRQNQDKSVTELKQINV